MPSDHCNMLQQPDKEISMEDGFDTSEYFSSGNNTNDNEENKSDKNLDDNENKVEDKDNDSDDDKEYVKEGDDDDDVYDREYNGEYNDNFGNTSDTESNSNQPEEEEKFPQKIVIVGGGIIGICTAFFLTQHPLFDPKKYKITLIEATRPVNGASGKAGGLLALWAFPHQLVPLSFKLHAELADEYNGEKEWDYRRLNAIFVNGDITKNFYKLKNSSFAPRFSYATNNTFANFSDIPITKANLKTNEIDSESFHSVSDSESDESVFDNGEDSDDSSSNKKNKSTKKSKKNKKNKKVSNSRYTHDNYSNNDDYDNENNSCDSIPGCNSRYCTPYDLDWIDRSCLTDCSTVGGKDSTAQVHPYKFSMFFLRKAQEAGVELVYGKVDHIIYDSNNKATGVAYSSCSNSAPLYSKTPSSTSVKALGEEYNKKFKILDADKIILCAGPWMARILPTCPISGLRAHSITLTPSKPVSPYAIFSELKIIDPSLKYKSSLNARSNSYLSMNPVDPNSAQGVRYAAPELYARRDEVYICGEGDTFVGLPETTDDVEISSQRCEDLFRSAAALSPNLLANAKLRKRQACYLPVIDLPSVQGPLMGKTNIKNLYMAAGHACWGINNAPATGKIMAEIVLQGKSVSAKVNRFDPRRYFTISTRQK